MVEEDLSIAVSSSTFKTSKYCGTNVKNTTCVTRSQKLCLLRGKNYYDLPKQNKMGSRLSLSLSLKNSRLFLSQPLPRFSCILS
jgi:hypothetical protein